MIVLNTLSIAFISNLFVFYTWCWAAEPMSVLVSIAPQKYFVQQIGKDLVNVQILVESVTDPHTCEPKPQQKEFRHAFK